MLHKTVISAAAVTLSLAMAQSAFAAIGSNGTQVNGLGSNGTQINGLMNNGIMQNGIKANGVKQNGLAASGATLGASIIAVELPADR